ncbi:MAG: RNA-binding protein YhbY [Gammaproteobacteria bacterium]|jgi:RNA-binding protein|nr:RNA-binding protein YhbY [Gammaproteobacteria bacterium]
MISKAKIRELRSQAHSLNPVVMLGSKGYTETVQAEIERALFDHELIKIRISGLERDEKRELAQHICETHQAELVQMLGHILTVYRKTTR